MTGSPGEWERYEGWSAAIAEALYTPEVAGLPVYLDLEDAVLEEIRDRAEPSDLDPAATLIEVVMGTLPFRSGAAGVLRGHISRLRQWHEGSMTDSPPTLGFLAMLSLVAEHMHLGDGMRQHNFWGRLAELLHLGEHELAWFQQAYRRQQSGTAVSTLLWDSLNDWLEILEGNRGLPTAYALGHDHIGLPLSQALVRRADRDKFADLFASNGLPPRSSLPAYDMEELLAAWISRVPCPATNTLERLWLQGGAARERITEVACLTLESWDGTASTTTQSGPQRPYLDAVRVRASLRTFPQRQLEISLLVPAGVRQSDEATDVLDVLDANGVTTATVDLYPAASGYLGLADPSEIDAPSLLDGEVLLRRGDQQQLLRRRPRRVVPLRRDDLLQAYVETERVQLGEESLVLVRAENANRAVTLLDLAARPGFVRYDELPGLPDAWTLFAGVQILSTIPRDILGSTLVDFNVLQPIAASHVVLQGGLRLPGNIAKWSSALPPELRVSTDQHEPLTACITCVRALSSPAPDARTKTADAVLIWDLGEERLPDGDYQIEVLRAGDLMRREALRLRSADSPAVTVDAPSPPICHDQGAAGYSLIASRSSAASAFRGATDACGAPEATTPPDVPNWFVARTSQPSRSSRTPPVRFPEAGQQSCFATGAHYMNIEAANQGQPSVEGVCKHCGLTKRYPAMRGKLKSKKKGAAKEAAPLIDVHGLAPVRSATTIDWRAGFDAVCHAGWGPAAALARVAEQMEATSLFGDSFSRTLEVLAHIEVERDSPSLASSSWEVLDPLLIGLPDETVTLAGFRSESMLVAAEDYIWACRGEMRVDVEAEAPPIINIKGLSSGELLELTAVIANATGRPARYVPNAGAHLAACLAPLSQARGGLPSTSATKARSYERWNPATARFEPATDAGHPGAYRLTGHTRAYVYRTADDLETMRATLGDARIVKYLAGADGGHPLVGYDSTSQVLYVPLGADLPGLYGRAAVLASGYPPRENTADRILEYRSVPPTLAALVSNLLIS
jgi:hypothetical protein